jgi:hypothetical protein
MRVSVAGRIFLVVLATMLVAGPAVAQQTGILSGVVRDAQGGMLPGVTITIASPALIGGARTTDTGGTGTYQFTALPPGV